MRQEIDDQSLEAWIREATERSRTIVEPLDDSELTFPYAREVTPVLWELAHICWFTEHWFLRTCLGEDSCDPEPERFDSRTMPHEDRWDLDMPSREALMARLDMTEERTLAGLRAGKAVGEARRALLLSIFHHDMHNEAWTYMRQSLGQVAPPTRAEVEASREDRADRAPAAGSGSPAARGTVADADLDGDASFGAGTHRLGACGSFFHFDNEAPARELEHGAFRIARRLVTQGEFRAFVEAGGYADARLWDEAGLAWLREQGRDMPRYWRRTDGGFARRRFDEWVPLEDDAPVVHVTWWEAEAFCRWAGRRLPTELEWEVAATEGRGHVGRYPWGDEVESAGRANMDWHALEPLPAGAFAGGRTAQGVTQLIGDAWEWTASPFEPFPGFEPGCEGRFYREYSVPFFGDHKVMRGGSFATATRMLSTSFRNFYPPRRNDHFAGFRTCARD
ncbi:MAG: selenoneine synthase SenA [Planctomycetota bacterium]